MSEPLSEEEDAFGRLLDYLAGEAGQLILELDDGRAGLRFPRLSSSPSTTGAGHGEAPRGHCAW